MDIDMDHNLDLVVVVNGKFGKRLFIFPLMEKIEPRPFLMLENYHQIQFQDLNQDGLTEIIAYTKKDNLLQPPSLFHFQSGTLLTLNNADFPLFMNQYYSGLQSKSQLYKKVNNPILQREVLLTEMRYHIAMDDIHQASAIYSAMVAKLPDSGAERKLSIYRGKILLAYAFLKTGNEPMMETILREAVQEFYSGPKSHEEIESQILAEKGSIYLQAGNYKKAEENASQSLKYNPNNATSLQILEWLPKP
jgi:tetratricopeptide (TPR) repeat protein